MNLETYISVFTDNTVESAVLTVGFSLTVAISSAMFSIKETT